MARYTKEQIIKALECCMTGNCSVCPIRTLYCSTDVVIGYALEYLKADVVPRSEVEKIFEEIHKEIALALDSNYKARQEHIDKHFKGIFYVYDNFISLVDGKIQALRGIDDFIDELKKKYIGE